MNGVRIAESKKRHKSWERTFLNLSDNWGSSDAHANGQSGKDNSKMEQLELNKRSIATRPTETPSSDHPCLEFEHVMTSTGDGTKNK